MPIVFNMKLNGLSIDELNCNGYSEGISVTMSINDAATAVSILQRQRLMNQSRRAQPQERDRFAGEDEDDVYNRDRSIPLVLDDTTGKIIGVQ